MNDGFVRARSEDFARRVMGTKRPVAYAFQLALGRSATESEVMAATRFLSHHKGSTLEKWTDFCQTIFALNEFTYID